MPTDRLCMHEQGNADRLLKHHASWLPSEHRSNDEQPHSTDVGDDADLALHALLRRFARPSGARVTPARPIILGDAFCGAGCSLSYLVKLLRPWPFAIKLFVANVIARTFGGGSCM